MRGDHDAFAALIGASANRLYALASLILRDTDRAQDATQEAIVRAWAATLEPGLPSMQTVAPNPVAWDAIPVTAVMIASVAILIGSSSAVAPQAQTERRNWQRS